MNNSIQQEIAAPKDCNKKLWYLIIGVAELLLMSLVLLIVTLCYNNVINNKYLTPMLFIGIIVAIGIVAAVLTRKHFLVTIIVLALTALNAEVLLTLNYVMTTSGVFALVRQIITITLSFGVIYMTLFLLTYHNLNPRERDSRAMRSTKYLTYCAMFTALAVICKMIGNAVSNVIPIGGTTLKFTIVYIPWVIGGIVLGPIGGFAAAAIGDLIGQIAVSTGGSPFPELTLANGLFAVFPAIAFKLYKHHDVIARAIIAMMVGTIISSFVCTLGISTFSLYSRIFYMSFTYEDYLIIRLPQLLIIFINILIMIPLILALIKSKIIKQPISPLFD